MEARRRKCGERSFGRHLGAPQAAFGYDQLVDGQIFPLEAYSQLETFSEERLHSQSHLLVEIVMRQFTQRCGLGFVRFGFDVELVCSNPTWASGEFLVEAEAVGVRDNLFERHCFGGEAVGAKVFACDVVVRLAGADTGDRERRPRICRMQNLSADRDRGHDRRRNYSEEEKPTNFPSV